MNKVTRKAICMCIQLGGHLRAFAFVAVATGLIGWSQSSSAQTASIPTPTSTQPSASSITATANDDAQKEAASPSPAAAAPLAMPKLSAIKVRVDEELTVSTKNGDKKLFHDIGTIRTDASNAIVAMMKGPGKKLTDNDTENVMKAAQASLTLCNKGTDYIQARIRKNSSREFIVSTITSLFGVGVAASTVNTTTRIFGVATALSANHKDSIVKEGDSGRNSTELRNILEDVRSDLAIGLRAFNAAVITEAKDDKELLKRHRDMQSAALFIYETCVMF